MSIQSKKCVMIIDETLPVGIIANTAGILGITLGKSVPELVGIDVLDKSNKPHLGITWLPVPILKADKYKIKDLRNQLYEADFSNLVIVDFNDIAQSCKTYNEFTDKMAETNETDLTYFGIAIYGDKKLINKLTGSMALLR